MLSLRRFLADAIRRFIALRRLSGTDYHSQALLLAAFDRFVAAQALEDEPSVSRQLLEAYQQSLSALAPRTRANRMGVVRQLCRYLAARDPRVPAPEPLRAIPSPGAHVPYLYSREEVQTLLAGAAALPPPGSLRPHTIATVLGLLYSTGLRVGEVLALNLGDFHPAEQRLFIAAGKFRKARWIPLAPSVCQALENYIQRRLAFTPQGLQAPLFVNLHGQRLHHCSLNRDFHRLLAHCGIARGQHASARLQDFRHYADSRIMPNRAAGEWQVAPWRYLESA